MCFQGYQGEVDPQGGHENPGVEEVTQIMQLSQAHVAQIVCSTVSQALTQQIQSIVQPIQTRIIFDVSTYEGDSVASWLTWRQRVVYQAKTRGFEAELTADEQEGVSVGAEVFYGSNVL